MVDETHDAGASVSSVARRHGVAPNQLFSWLRLASDGALTAAGAGEPVVPASESIADASDGLPEIVDGPCADTPEVCLQLGEGHFDGIKIGAVGRQEEEPRAARLNDRFGFLAFVA